MHTDFSQKEEAKAEEILYQLLTEGMEYLHHRDIPLMLLFIFI